MKIVSPSATAAVTAALIQSTKELSISSPASPSSSSTTSSSSSASLPSHSPEMLTPKKLQGPRKKVPFKPSKRQQKREKATRSGEPETRSLHRRHPSVFVPAKHDYTYNVNAWSDLSSVVKNSGDRTKELVLEWDEAIDEDERLVEIAKVAVDRTEVWFEDGETDAKRILRMLNLSSSLRCFVEHCRNHLTNISSYKLKLTAMHGSNATRCPLWHADNVPIRWIQTYKGPGCNIVHEEPYQTQPNPQSGNDNDDSDISSSRLLQHNSLLQRVRESDHDVEARKYGPDWKERLVELSRVPVTQSPIGEPALLVGRMWYAWSIEQQQQQYYSDDAKSPPEGPMAGVLHRSPHNVPGGRILLNLDVVCRNEEDDDSDAAGDHHHHHDHSQCGGDCLQQEQQQKHKKKEGWFRRKGSSSKTKASCGDNCTPKSNCPC